MELSPTCCLSRAPSHIVWKGEAVNLQHSHQHTSAHISTHQHTSAWGKHAGDRLGTAADFPETQQKISADSTHTHTHTPVHPSPALFLQQWLLVWTSGLEHFFDSASQTKPISPLVSRRSPTAARREKTTQARQGTRQVRPGSVLRKPFNSSTHYLADAVCSDGLLTGRPKQNSIYCTELSFHIHKRLLSLSSTMQRRRKKKKGTTQSKIDIMMKLAAVALVVVLCSSVQASTPHYCWQGEENSAASDQQRATKALERIPDRYSANMTSPPDFLRVSKITSPVTFMAMEEI